MMVRVSLDKRMIVALRLYPQLRGATNTELADHLGAHPGSISQSLSRLHNDGRIRVWFDGDLHPTRHIDVYYD